MNDLVDLNDKKIIYELDINGFQTLSSIAKKTRMSKQVISYRLSQLINKKIIKKIYSIINLESLGYVGQKIYFQMQNITKSKELELINYFQNHKKIIWFGIYEGRFDFVISIYTKNKNELDKELSKIINDLQNNIVDFEITSYTGVLALKKKYLLNKKSNEEFSYFGSNKSIITLDKLNQKIIRALCLDARTKIITLANKNNCSSDTIISRIKKMKKELVIQGSRVMLNKKLLGIHEFKLLLKLKKYDDITHNKFVTFAKNNPYIAAYIKCVGPWNLELDIEIPDLQKYHNLILELKTLFSDSIKTIESLMMHDEFKYNFYPF